MISGLAFIAFSAPQISFQEYFSPSSSNSTLNSTLSLREELAIEGFVVDESSGDNFQFIGYLIPPPPGYKVIDCGLEIHSNNENSCANTCEISDFPMFYELEFYKDEERVFDVFQVEQVASSSNPLDRPEFTNYSAGDALHLCSISQPKVTFTFDTHILHSGLPSKQLLLKYLTNSPLTSNDHSLVLIGPMKAIFTQ